MFLSSVRPSLSLTLSDIIPRPHSLPSCPCSLPSIQTIEAGLRAGNMPTFTLELKWYPLDSRRRPSPATALSPTSRNGVREHDQGVLISRSPHP